MVDLAHIRFGGSEPDWGKRKCSPGVQWQRNPGLPKQQARAPFPEGAPAGIDPFAADLLERAGLDPLAYRALPLHRRIPACLRQLRVPSINAAKALLDAQPELAQKALNALLIGVTGFFRDIHVFDSVRSLVLPELLTNRADVSVSSLGSADGQELYSVAMLLGEADGLDRSSFLGLDCREEAIAKAQAGAFEEKDLEPVEPRLRTRYFCRREGLCWIVPQVRRRTEWRVGNVSCFEGMQAWDLILFRNLAIYLDPSCLASLWLRLYASLRPGGYLVTGTAEKPPRKAGFTRIAACIYRKEER